MPRHSSRPSGQNSGFTIVELLVVIVVIAILATISVMSYIGVQNRAKATKAQVSANAVRQTAEAYFVTNYDYPISTTEFSTSLAELPANIILLTGTTSLTAENGNESILYKTTTGATGACIMYWDYESDAISSPIFLGDATSANCSSATGIQLAS